VFSVFAGNRASIFLFGDKSTAAKLPLLIDDDTVIVRLSPLLK
jgi:hypothetical protein